MLPTLSNEGRIDAILRSLNCTGRAFEGIATAKGVAVAHTAFVLAMHPDPSKRKTFDHRTGTRLLEIARTMRDLQNHFSIVPISWSESERVAMAITWMLIRQTAAEQGFTDLAQNAGLALDQEIQSP